MNPPVVPCSIRATSTIGRFGESPNHERAEPHGKHCQAEHKPLRLGRVKQLSSGYLGHQAGNTADGQDKTDVFWRPALTSKKERYKRPKTGQSAPYKKIDCVESTKTLIQRRGV